MNSVKKNDDMNVTCVLVKNSEKPILDKLF